MAFLNLTFPKVVEEESKVVKVAILLGTLFGPWRFFSLVILITLVRI